MSKFHSLKVAEVVRETADAVSVAFEVPANLKQEYQYKQGQYLTLKFVINGQELRRSYSICSGPLEAELLRVAVKKVKDGRVSTHINDSVKAGDVLEVMIPMGNFYTEMNAANKKNYVLFAGGSGITPMMSILKTVLKAEPNSTVTLLYGNNDEASVIFKQQLDAIVQANAGRIKLVHVLNNAPAGFAPVQSGLMTKEKNIELIKNFVDTAANSEYFICGPGPMMENVKAALNELKVDESHIHIEYFTTPVNADDAAKAPVNNASGSKATIILDGDEHEVVLEANETVLEAAIRIGLDAPYACQGGSCCTCRALLEEGQVEMTVNYALSSSEVKQGYILTCQSHPKTPSIKVNYDKGL